MSIYVAPRPATAPAMKAGPIGQGAGVLLTEFPLATILGRSAQAKMRQAYKIGMEVPWVRKAEQVIAAKVSTVPLTLEDGDEQEIDDDYPQPNAVAAYDLLTTPQKALTVGQPLTRSQLWRLTSRHMGLCGNGFWLNDAMNAFGIPNASVYIRPDRMTPKEDAQGNLTGWYIDKTAQQPGIEVSLEQVLHFMLEPPDEGHFGPGLVETWLLRSRITTALDQQLSQVLSSGGRITGILSPKAGTIEPGSDTALQMERDWRTITEQPDAARRLQIVYAPVEFTKTTLNMDELRIVELMKLMRDDGLAFWGVPPSIAGIPSASGLNSGDTRKYDEAALWQGPVHDRLVVISELLQDNLLDRFEALLGYSPSLLLQEPAFDDDSPRYDLLGKSINIAMRNSERRDLVGLEPFGDPQWDDAVWMPATMVPAFTVPAAGEPGATAIALGRAQAPIDAAPPSDAASAAAGETTQGKASISPRVAPLHASLTRLRTRLQTAVTPRLRSSVASVLADQKAEIIARIRAREAHIRANPSDTSAWWDKPRWDKRLTEAMSGHLAGVADTISGHIADVLAPKAGKADPVQRVLTRGAARVQGINDTTRDAIIAALQSTADGTIGDAIDAVEALDIFDEYRSELIARTELMDAYNASALGSYSDFGVTQVEAIDGDGDEECAARDGQTFSIDEADAIEDHPNGTLDWVPVIGEEIATEEAKARPVAQPEFSPALMAMFRAAIDYGNRAELRPVINVEAPVVNVPAPVVNITTPAQPEPVVNVTVAAAPTPEVTVPVTVSPAAVILPDRKPVTKRIKRDAEGQITEVTET